MRGPTAKLIRRYAALHRNAPAAHRLAYRAFKRAWLRLPRTHRHAAANRMQAELLRAAL
jgi:hypothetical protein